MSNKTLTKVKTKITTRTITLVALGIAMVGGLAYVLLPANRTNDSIRNYTNVFKIQAVDYYPPYPSDCDTPNEIGKLFMYSGIPINGGYQNGSRLYICANTLNPDKIQWQFVPINTDWKPETTTPPDIFSGAGKSITNPNFQLYPEYNIPNSGSCSRKENIGTMRMYYNGTPNGSRLYICANTTTTVNRQQWYYVPISTSWTVAPPAVANKTIPSGPGIANGTTSPQLEPHYYPPASTDCDVPNEVGSMYMYYSKVSDGSRLYVCANTNTAPIKQQWYYTSISTTWKNEFSDKEVWCEESQPWATLPQKYSLFGGGTGIANWYKKEKKDGTALIPVGPGPNVFSSSNISVANDGMHLKIINNNGVWSSSEIVTDRCYKYGSFRFVVSPKLADGTTIDKLDPNIVLGLFTYPEAKSGEGELDGLHEIDIELANFELGGYNLNYSAYPASESDRTIKSISTKPLKFTLLDSTTPVVFTINWTATKITYSATQNYKSIGEWFCGPNEVNKCSISSRPQPIHINFWLKGGQAPLNQKNAEVIINSFNYSPEKAPVF
jgi:hypothetical protein